MPKRSSSSRSARLWPLLLILPALIALLDVERCTSSAPKPLPEREPTSTDERGAPEPEARSRENAPSVSRASQPEEATTLNETCAKRARKGCHEGNVWWFDSCDRANEEIEACDGRPCLSTSCALATPRRDDCGDVTALGTCTGDVASACVAGHVVRVDCAVKKNRCAITREGAQCLARTPLDCSPTDAATCEGNALRHCVDGTWQSVDCAQRLGRCAQSRGRAQCIATQAPSAATAAFERCDGADEDRDGRVDEGATCDQVALVAFVAGAVTPAREAQLARELATLNRVFQPIAFRWEKITATQLSPVFDPADFDQLAKDLTSKPMRAAVGLHPALAFYIPVLFVDAILSEPPKGGLSSLPNASCGGVRISDQPSAVHGLVVVSEQRQPETLAHELGHYLGLCHTHDEITAYGLAEQIAECKAEGDGICDTPRDPGPDNCALLAGCGTTCADLAAQPDTSNVMSYYMPCRSGLSAEQMRVVERGLSLRRGWFACLKSEECPCVVGNANVCPAAMSCQPTGNAADGQCVLDGPALPGAPCSDVSECSEGAVCMGAGSGKQRKARCARTCRLGEAKCDCVETEMAFGVCGKDLR